ncbi:MAG: MBL fold metallo-hydrolase, partial [Nannocystaceae bacterium]
MADVRTIDTLYLGNPRFAACFLLTEGERAAFVETNTNFAVPRLLEALRASGRRPEDVDYVIVTHVHLDHAGGASKLMAACPNATLLAHPRAAPHLIDPSKLVASARQVYGAERFAALYGEIEAIAA